MAPELGAISYGLGLGGIIRRYIRRERRSCATARSSLREGSREAGGGEAGSRPDGSLRGGVLPRGSGAAPWSLLLQGSPRGSMPSLCRDMSGERGAIPSELEFNRER